MADNNLSRDVIREIVGYLDVRSMVRFASTSTTVRECVVTMNTRTHGWNTQLVSHTIHNADIRQQIPVPHWLRSIVAEAMDNQFTISPVIMAYALRTMNEELMAVIATLVCTKPLSVFQDAGEYKQCVEHDN